MAVRDELADLVKPERLIESRFGPVLGTHLGPNTIGVAATQTSVEPPHDDVAGCCTATNYQGTALEHRGGQWRLWGRRSTREAGQASVVATGPLPPELRCVMVRERLLLSAESRIRTRGRGAFLATRPGSLSPGSSSSRLLDALAGWGGVAQDRWLGPPEALRRPERPEGALRLRRVEFEFGDAHEVVQRTPSTSGCAPVPHSAACARHPRSSASRRPPPPTCAAAGSPRTRRAVSSVRRWRCGGGGRCAPRAASRRDRAAPPRSRARRSRMGSAPSVARPLVLRSSIVIAA